MNGHAEAIARAALATKGIEASDTAAYPTSLQLPFRRIVARSGDDVRVDWLSVMRPRPIEWESFTQARGPLVEAARSLPEARLFEWFAMGQATPRVEGTSDGSVVELDDLRYGLPGHPREGHRLGWKPLTLSTLVHTLRHSANRAWADHVADLGRSAYLSCCADERVPE